MKMNAPGKVGEGIGVDKAAEPFLGLQEFPIGVVEQFLAAVGNHGDAGEGEHELGPGVKE